MARAKQSSSYVKYLNAIPEGSQFQDILEGDIFNLLGSAIFYMKIKFNQSFYVVNLQTGIAQTPFSPTTEIVSRKRTTLSISTVRTV